MEKEKYYTPTIEEYYLYRHVRIDKNEVFYIGIGRKQDNFSGTIKNEYKRAYSLKRNSFWKNITSKTDFVVEIIAESNSKDFIINKEIEFIELYKRKEFGGTLCNLTFGGEGAFGMKHSIDRNFKISNALKKRVRRSETFKLISENKKKKVCRYINGVLDKEYDSITSASIDVNRSLASISKCINGRGLTCGGFTWKLKQLSII